MSSRQKYFDWYLRRVTATLSVVLAVGLGLPMAAVQAASCPDAPAGMNVIVSNDPLIVGTNKDDFICAGPGNNTIVGRGGDDIIYGGGGDDLIKGKAGNDELHGGGGDDKLRGQRGNDTLFGDNGSDHLQGNGGRDTIDGGGGDDVVVGGPGHDVLRGSDGDDVVSGKDGNDTARGGAGDDVVRGGDGDDVLLGGADNDQLFGGNGDDRLDGQLGIDEANGGNQRDTCINNTAATRCELPGDQPEPVPDPDLDDDGVTAATDCDDKDSSVYPGAPEAPGDGIDQNCDGEDAVENPRLVNRSSVGVLANETSDSSQPSVSADGRLVVYVSTADNLVANGDNNFSLYLTNLDTGNTRLIETPMVMDPWLAGSVGGPVISADGAYVAFHALPDQSSWPQVYMTNIATGESLLVSAAADGTPGNASSGDIDLSADGRYVTYMSRSTNLVEGDEIFKRDILRTDTLTGQTVRVSVAADGGSPDDHSYAPAISANGRYVTYSSWADNILATDTNYTADIFRADLVTGQTVLVSRKTDGSQWPNPSYTPDISADGRFIAYEIDHYNGQDAIMLTDVQTGTTTAVSVGLNGAPLIGNSRTPSISADGRFVAFASAASNLVTGDQIGCEDVFLTDTETGVTTRLSEATWSGEEANGDSYAPAVSSDGSVVVFTSELQNYFESPAPETNVFVFENE